MATEVAADALGEEWKGYVVRISGRNDKQGEKDIPGLTDTTVPYRLGPKRASRIRKLFNLSKEDDVHQYVVQKPLNKDEKESSALRKDLNSPQKIMINKQGRELNAQNIGLAREKPRQPQDLEVPRKTNLAATLESCLDYYLSITYQPGCAVSPAQQGRQAGGWTTENSCFRRTTGEAHSPSVWDAFSCLPGALICKTKGWKPKQGLLLPTSK
ncbi:hypothetical protein E5288_WYG009804 [Bos mutus]|uniref:Small ribosomal subunit protein eS6 n=1 Tax=Bos mutus TaxID=72004 RepID=A0A6B0QXN2_9CETA|nr:hypothetical protein [Bos mutus]